jgi:hypothetical protein
METPFPAQLVPIPSGHVWNPFVHDNHFGCVTLWFERNRDALGSLRLGVDAPGVHELMRRIDNFEFSEYP